MEIRVGGRKVGVREQRVSVDPAAQTLREKLATARVRCQRGGEPREGRACMDCEHMVDALPHGNGIVVRCGWDGHDPVREVMTLPAAWRIVSPTATVMEARSLLVHETSELLVIDAGNLVGFVTGRQLAAATSDRNRVAMVMSTRITGIAPDTWLSTCAELLRDPEVACLAVVEGSRLVGLVARSDLARMGMSCPSA